MIDCSRDGYGNYGCGGGDEKGGMRYAMDKAILLESEYPYTATD